MRSRLFALPWIALALWAGRACAQSTRVEDIGIGKLLVASRSAPDPVFGETVILLVRYENDGTLGLVINRRTKVAVSEALKELNGSKQRQEPIFLGGPVDTSTVFGLLRATTMPEGTGHVTGKIYLLVNRAVLEKTLAGSATSSDFRVYLGYSGWSKGQLENEVKLGVWQIFPGSADLAFDSEPDTLWSRLIARAEQRIARGGSAFPLLTRQMFAPVLPFGARSPVPLPAANDIR